MCTAATYQTKNTYFGRNLDYNISYGEEERNRKNAGNNGEQ